ncbi:uncharacterized protein LOC120280256 isoform X1 [Dioscorea cayenensis subsp. rotundata]|uniref:Uncharacterized protein LOC120280256 isoform X1 n=1 Tax=Dioscorea cayennensis subsp. rotundata TaxID=55577 RepID=A0AB40CVX4_DIOCR|nr:uncharacterized protein LOC120280256 isoform X1 [Dioscorea cayenensis subsp. rotundata]XP_039142966.1 uncharacterized protein LOC120280256 isoform X1 [Dioscorea cayenensis subsp. rotundata]
MSGLHGINLFALKRVIKSVKVSCVNAKYRCNETLAYSHYEVHQKPAIMLHATALTYLVHYGAPQEVFRSTSAATTQSLLSNSDMDAISLLQLIIQKLHCSILCEIIHVATHVNNGNLNEAIYMLELFKNEGFDSGDFPEISAARNNVDPTSLTGSFSGTNHTI